MLNPHATFLASLALCLPTACSPSADAESSPAEVSGIWRAEVGRHQEDLLVLPQVRVLPAQEEGGTPEVLVANVGECPLRFRGYEPLYPQHFQEIWRGHSWGRGDYQWCGSGMKTFELAPGKSVVFHLRTYESKTPYRIVTSFRDPVGERESFIVLAEMPPWEEKSLWDEESQEAQE